MRQAQFKRIQNEFYDIYHNPPKQWSLTSVKQSEWIVTINCTNNCSFFDDPFQIIIKFPKQYPLNKPDLRVKNPQRFFHPNIGLLSGSIYYKTVQEYCVSTLIRDRIQAVIQILVTPNPNDPINRSAANLYLKSIEQYNRKALKIFKNFKKVDFIQQN